ncbi:MAG: alpha/beta hydrolase [Nevskiales bacterium]|nr:alpha/beta hydrolase [Nevskiales bacterium]
MNAKPYLYVSASIFTLMALMHRVRILQGWPVQLGEQTIPMTASWVGIVIAGGLALWGFCARADGGRQTVVNRAGFAGCGIVGRMTAGLFLAALLLSAPVRFAEAAAEDVELIENLAYREGNPAWTLDLALPRSQGSTRRPALVIIHGGGWRSGDKADARFRNLLFEYAVKGYVTVSLNYRLSGEAPFPASVEDVKTAVRWLRAHAGKYDVDPGRIGAYGNSAGAHLAAMLGLVGPDVGLEGDGPYRDQSSLVQAVCVSATATDFIHFEGGNGKNAVQQFLAGPAASLSERTRRASPLTYVHAKAPPFLIIHGTNDATVPFSQGASLAEALKTAGANVTFLEIKEGSHKAMFEKGSVTKPAMEAFFARTLKPAAKNTKS